MFNKELLKKVVYEQVPSEIIDSIIVFGSRARGDETPDSDTDIFIVTKTDLERKERFDFCKKIRVAFAKELNGVDVIVKPKNEFERFCNIPGALEYNVLKEGIRL